MLLLNVFTFQTLLWQVVAKNSLNIFTFNYLLDMFQADLEMMKKFKHKQ